MYNVSIAIAINKPPYITVRQYRDIMKRNNAIAAQTWHKTFLPRHFTQPAKGGGRYGYATRDPIYLRNKRKRANNTTKWRRGKRGKRTIEGGRLAIVQSGETRHRAVDFPPGIKAFPTRVVLTMRVPKYASMKTAKGPNLGKEITKVLPEEAKILRKQLFRRVRKEYDTARKANKKTVKV